MNTKKKIIPLGAMARIAGVSSKWLRKEAEAGRIPHLKADNRLLFEPETVKAILIERAEKGGIDGE